MKRFARGAIVGLVGVTIAGAVQALDHFLMVGGGPSPKESEVSIEKNVIWIDRITRGWSFASHSVLFASGPHGPADVVLHSPGDPEVQNWLPLARVYGEQEAAMSVFRRNEVADVSSATSREAVTATLRRGVASLAAGDGLLFVYNGHGSLSKRDTSRNGLRLWGESRLDVRDLAALLDDRPAGTTFRGFFPQCFSGGFARIAFRDVVTPRTAELRPGTCGFFSVADNRTSEGCTPSVDMGEYRDYSTYFFAALDGRTRLDKPLHSGPDADSDGRISLAEAHRYAYIEGRSADVPRSTSEYFLEAWRPWFVRWHSTVKPSPENPYLRTATALAGRLGLQAQDMRELAVEVLQKRRAVESEIAATERELKALKAEEAVMRERLRVDLEREWAGAGKPHTAAFQRLVTRKQQEMLAWITAQAEYPRLEELQERIQQVDLGLLDWRREAAGYIRIQRMLDLATTKEHFDRLAGSAERANYAALVECESWVPPVLSDTALSGR
jgi:hypothetical protein